MAKESLAIFEHQNYPMKLPLAYIRLITLVYIAFPLMPFFIGWLKPLFAIPLTLILLWGVYEYFKDLNFKEVEIYFKRDLIIGFSLVTIWLLFSGAGGMGYQFPDHIKHNAVIKDLSTLSWPISYSIDSVKVYFSHYLSFYIIGPLFGNFLSFKYIQLIVFLWTALGVYLGTFWLARATGFFNWKFFLFLIFFGGVVLVSFILKYKTDFIIELIQRSNNHGFVFWMNAWEVLPLSYMHITDLLYWSPQHLIPALLGVGIVLNDGLIDRNIKFTPFVLSLLLMWSPMILVGLFPFFLFILYKERLRNIFNPVNFLLAPILFIVCGIFLLSIDANGLVKHFIFNYISDIPHSIWAKLGVFFYFLFVEVIIWALPIYFVLRLQWNSTYKELFALVLAILFLVPLFRYGLWNDWCTKVSVPSIIILMIYAYKAFMQSKGSKWKIVIVCLLIVSSIGPLMDIRGSLRHLNYLPKFASPYGHQVEGLNEMSKNNPYPIDQFIASENTFFFKYLAKKK